MDAPVDAPFVRIGGLHVLDTEDDGNSGLVAVVGCVAGEEEVDFDGCWVGYVCFGGEGWLGEGCPDGG